jgi:hypothetical protein
MLVRLTPQNVHKTAPLGTSLPQLGQYGMMPIFFSKYKEFSLSDPRAQPSGFPIGQTYLYVLVAVVIAIAVGSIAFMMRRKKKPPELVTPTAPTA